MNDLTNIHVGDIVVIHGTTLRNVTVIEESTTTLHVYDPKDGFTRVFSRLNSYERTTSPNRPSAVYITAKEPSK